MGAAEEDAVLPGMVEEGGRLNTAVERVESSDE